MAKDDPTAWFNGDDPSDSEPPREVVVDLDDERVLVPTGATRAWLERRVQRAEMRRPRDIDALFKAIAKIEERLDALEHTVNLAQTYYPLP